MNKSLPIILVSVTSVFGFLLSIGCRVVKAEKRSYVSSGALSSGPRIYVMVLGAAASTHGPSAELEARLKAVLSLEKQVSPEKYFLYGGIDKVDESLAMRNYLMMAGIDQDRLFSDSAGENTRSSVRRFAQEMNLVQHEQLIAVTSGFHAMRVATEARKCGLRIVAIAPRGSPEVMHPQVRRIRLASELAANLFYLLPSWVSTRVDTSPSSFRHRFPRWLIQRQCKKTRNGQRAKGLRE